jgi:hypothetical protein
VKLDVGVPVVIPDRLIPKDDFGFVNVIYRRGVFTTSHETAQERMVDKSAVVVAETIV